MQKAYLIHFAINRSNASSLKETSPIFMSVVQSLGKADFLYADQKCFGWILTTDRNASQIKSAIENGDYRGSATREDDRMFVVEIGNDFAWIGFGAIDSHLRHRK